MAKVPLTADAKTKSYYKYYELEIEEPDDAMMTYIKESKMPGEMGLKAKDRAMMQEPGTYPEKVGYYPLPEGGMLVAGNVPMPNVTPEMLSWWFAWHGLESFRYTIWDPEDHYSVVIDDIGRVRALDESIPMIERNWGATHLVVESMGGPADEIEIRFRHPEEMGFDVGKIGTEGCAFMVCANCKLNGVVPSMMIEVAKEIDGVMTYQVRFWMGYNVVDGEAKCLLPEGFQIPDAVAEGALAHCYKEFAHLNKILPKLYEEEKDNWL